MPMLVITATVKSALLRFVEFSSSSPTDLEEWVYSEVLGIWDLEFGV